MEHASLSSTPIARGLTEGDDAEKKKKKKKKPSKPKPAALQQKADTKKRK